MVEIIDRVVSYPQKHWYGMSVKNSTPLCFLTVYNISQLCNVIKNQNQNAITRIQYRKNYIWNVEGNKLSPVWRMLWILRSYFSSCSSVIVQLLKRLHGSFFLAIVLASNYLMDLTGYIIRMQHWQRPATDGTKFWISCKQPAFLSCFSRLQVIQNKQPWYWAVIYVTAG